MIINFKRNGIFSNIKGLIIGGMTDMNDNNICFGKNAEQIIFDYVQEYDFPMCFNFPSGHLNANRCLILGLKTMLIINENGVSLQQEY